MCKNHQAERKFCSKLFTQMPYPCSHFYFDIKFGHRLYSKEKRLSFSLLNIICRQIWYQSKSDYMDRAKDCKVLPWKINLLWTSKWIDFCLYLFKENMTFYPDRSAVTMKFMSVERIKWGQQMMLHICKMLVLKVR